jgi:hypothetical protein
MSSGEIYQLFVGYFGDLELHRVKRELEYSVYACNVESTSAENRMIYVIVPFRFARGDATTLSQLEWVSLQTRSSDDFTAGLPKYAIVPTRQSRDHLMFLFNSVNRSELKTDYRSPEIPIEMSIIHDLKKKNFLQCPDKVRLYTALESYRCVVQLL